MYGYFLHAGEHRSWQDHGQYHGRWVRLLQLSICLFQIVVCISAGLLMLLFWSFVIESSIIIFRTAKSMEMACLWKVSNEIIKPTKKQKYKLHKSFSDSLFPFYSYFLSNIVSVAFNHFRWYKMWPLAYIYSLWQTQFPRAIYIYTSELLRALLKGSAMAFWLPMGSELNLLIRSPMP